MVVLLLSILILAPLVLGPLLILHSYRCVLPRVMPIDEDATYAPEKFRHYVWDMERDLSPHGFFLIDCTVEMTGTPRVRYTAVFERENQTELLLATMGFDLDPYRAPRKQAYTEVEMVTRVQGGVWVVTSRAGGLRPGSFRVERLHAGRQPLEHLIDIHQNHVGARRKMPSSGISRDHYYAALVQESLATQEIYDALARRDLIQDEETGEIRPTWIGAIFIGWRHLGPLAWSIHFVRRLGMPHAEGDPVAAEESVLLSLRK